MEQSSFSLLKNNLDHQALAGFSFDQLALLSDEIRTFLVSSVSKTGGHLASNLGVVELTLMLHRVFDFSSDKLIFDVGHQAYVHKILTGRMDDFSSLRKFGGLSGFPNRAESKFDPLDTGHSSTSLSAALGFCAARDVLHQKYHVVAVIGDGALTGGLCFEALNNIGNLKTPLIIILNDNQMSISKNVGALSKHLTRFRTSRSYTNAKFRLTRIFKSIPGIGDNLYSFFKNTKDRIKYMFLPGPFFESMGIKYFGPIDGHDLRALDTEINRAKRVSKPVIIHVRTKKGKGYTPAEKYPENYHGVSEFDPDTGLENTNSNGFSKTFGDAMCALAKDEPRLVCVCPAMTEGCGLLDFSKKYPDRFFDCAIAEEHAVTFAAGLACAGLVPVVSVYSSFLQRAFDMLIHDAAINRAHVVFCIDRAGLVGADGKTHQGIFDLSYLSLIPDMAILSPASTKELSLMLDYAIKEHDGPIAIRYPKSGGCDKAFSPFVFKKPEIIHSGSDVTICAEGQMVSVALIVCSILEKEGIFAEVINLRTIKPLATDEIKKSYEKTHALVTLEANTVFGGIGQQIAAAVLPENLLIKAFPDTFVEHGSIPELLVHYRMDAKSCADDIIDFLKVCKRNEA